MVHQITNMTYAPVFDYRWGSGQKQVIDRKILESSRKYIIYNGVKREINYIPHLGDHGIHGGVLQVMRGHRQITYH